MYIYIYICAYQYKFAGSLAQSDERPWVAILFFLNSVAIAKRILPGTFCLKPCRLNLPHPNPKSPTIDGLIGGLPSVAVGTDCQRRV